MTEMTIGEVTRRTGLRPSALRYYEEAGILPPAKRVSGKRRYDETILTRLAVVRLAQDTGFSVAEIRDLVAGFEDVGVSPERWQEMASQKLTEVDALIARAETMKRLLEESPRCQCLTLDNCNLVLGRTADDRPASQADQAREAPARHPAGRSWRLPK